MNNVIALDQAQAPTIAPLKNVALCTKALETAMNRPGHLPGMVAFYGPSGIGKSMSAAYAANKYRAYYVECRSSWTKKALLLAICQSMGIAPAKTIYEMVDQVAEQLVISNRPLIIDEMDHLVDKSAVEIVRDIYESSGAAILLIGEELFPQKLRKWERFHNRVLQWQQAQFCDIADAQHLARLYCRSAKVEQDLIERVLQVSRGATRRVAINLEMIQRLAKAEGLDSVSLAEWGKRELYSGDAPARRAHA